MSDQLRRIGTALIAAPVVVGIAYVGGIGFALLIAAIGAIAQWELYGMARAAGTHPQQWAGMGLGALLVLGHVWPVAWTVAIGGGVVFLVVAPFWLPQERFLESLMVTLAGAVYPAGLLGALVALREARSEVVGSLEAFWLVLMTFFLVWATDIFAYYAGRTFGKRKLAPLISPNKTWEGSLGGATAALLVAVGFKLTVLDVLTWPHVAAVVVIAGVLSQAGDLAESQIKRSTGTKDAGAVLPGHGGFFDRFDSMVVAAPLMYVYLDVMGVV